MCEQACRPECTDFGTSKSQSRKVLRINPKPALMRNIA